MSVNFTPSLSFRGNAREAMEYYQSVFGGELRVITYGDAGLTEHDAQPDQVMHAMLTGPVSLMAADVPESMEFTPGSSIALSIWGDSADEAVFRDYFAKLSDGGSDLLPLNLAPWGDFYGQVTDRYGFTWMIDFSAPEVPADASSLLEGQQPV
ncbi:VOC family protein [Gryllotalpicola ginsengisoli]|uniref:VOC family protein n=1 Tax=Gryllotalpicola ginsengisoli TaxID=444608 RepID=UPI0003B4B8B3|nr:VOC family protein [Gryllotalpicola ginsengisoli]